MTTIPASAVARTVPNVLAAGGSALDLNGLLLTTSAVAPMGTVLRFGTQTLVANYFGATSDEATLASVYFKGFDNSNVKPGAILFAQYNLDDVAAYLRGGSLAGMTLSELQALNEAFSVTIDGVVQSATINLASATSFSNAAQLMQDALAIEGAEAANFTGSISGTTLTVTAVADGVIAVGQQLTGSGMTSTYVNAALSGTGGTGTYTVSVSQTAASQAIVATAPAVSYNTTQSAFQVNSGTVGNDSSVGYGSGALATSLKLTQALGAVLSEGADAAVPAAFMASIVNQTQNWAAFTLLFNPDDTGFAIREAFADWTDGTENRYAFAVADDDATAATTLPATGSLGYALQQANYSGITPIWAPTYDAAVEKCVFELGCFASIDFTQVNGRTTTAFRRQTGLTADVTDAETANNLGGDPQVAGDYGNGYNFYGAYAEADEEFVFFNRGTISGPYIWSDSYINQIWLNSGFRAFMLQLLLSARSIPYNQAGRTQIEAALQPMIDAALNFGAFRPGVPLSQEQRSAVNTEAGVNIADTLQNRGWYLQVLPSTAEARAGRVSPPCKFWYVDGQSVQAISLTSIQIQ